MLSCPTHAFQAEVLICDLKVQEGQEVARILDTKESLVKDWYEQKHGLRKVCFRINQKGTMHYMQFCFYSADVEAKVRSQLLKGRNDFEANVRVALYILRVKTELPVNVLKIVYRFIPDYVEHLAQEKIRVQKSRPWL